MDYSNLTLKEFADRLGSGDPTPGGGGASALAGCLGAALGNMVAHLTVGRKKYAAVQEEMEALIREAESLQDELLDLIGEDAALFEPLSRAYSMPRTTQEEKDAREIVMKEALKDACQVPIRIMEKMCRALELAKQAAFHGSSAAVSDAGDAAVFCKAALQGAALNVFINTKLMKDRTVAEEYNRKADGMLAKYVPLADEIYSHVLEQLRKP
jgi:formiminotetrahydrofolate cyclodeaminase